MIQEYALLLPMYALTKVEYNAGRMLVCSLKAVTDSWTYTEKSERKEIKLCIHFDIDLLLKLTGLSRNTILKISIVIVRRSSLKLNCQRETLTVIVLFCNHRLHSQNFQEIAFCLQSFNNIHFNKSKESSAPCYTYNHWAFIYLGLLK